MPVVGLETARLVGGSLVTVVGPGTARVMGGSLMTFTPTLRPICFALVLLKVGHFIIVRTTAPTFAIIMGDEQFHELVRINCIELFSFNFVDLDPSLIGPLCDNAIYPCLAGSYIGEGHDPGLLRDLQD